MDLGIPTEATLVAMRAGDAPVRYLVGTPKGRRTRLEQAHPGADLAGGAAVGHGQAPRRGGGTLHPGAECPAAAKGTRHAAAAAEDACGSGSASYSSKPIPWITLLLKLGAAKQAAGRAWALVDIGCPPPARRSPRRRFTVRHAA